MFATVIVPLDGSPHAEAAVPFAVAEARHHGATLVLLRVVVRPEPCRKPPRGPVMGHDSWPLREREADEREAVRYLSDVRRRFDLPRETRLIVAVGEPVARVRAEARRQPRPLVVLTTGDAATFPAPHLSEVARRLLATGEVPVLAVRAPACSGGTDRAGLPTNDVRHVLVGKGDEVGLDRRVALR